jgi:hypothetical protein
MLWEVYPDGEDDLVGTLVFEEGEDFEGSIEVIGDSVVHDDELSLGRGDFKGFVGEELIVLDWLVEVAVIEDDAAGSIGLSECDFLVEDEFEGGVACEVALHLYAAVDGGVDHVSWGVEEDVYLLEDVDEDFVLVRLAAHGHVGGRWVDCAGGEDGEVADLLLYVLDWRRLLLHHFAGNEGLYVRGIGELGMSEVNYLIQYFID